MIWDTVDEEQIRMHKVNKRKDKCEKLSSRKRGIEKIK